MIFAQHFTSLVPPLSFAPDSRAFTASIVDVDRRSHDEAEKAYCRKMILIIYYLMRFCCF